MFTTNRNQIIANQHTASVTEHDILFKKKSSEKIRRTLTSLNLVVALIYSWWREEITKAHSERRNMRIT